MRSKSFAGLLLLALMLVSGCSSMKTRPVGPSVDYPLTRPLSVVTEQTINPISQ